MRFLPLIFLLFASFVAAVEGETRTNETTLRPQVELANGRWSDRWTLSVADEATAATTTVQPAQALTIFSSARHFENVCNTAEVWSNTNGCFLELAAPQGWSANDLPAAVEALTTEPDNLYRGTFVGAQTLTLNDGLAGGEEIVVSNAHSVTGDLTVNGVSFAEGAGNTPTSLTLVPGEVVRLQRQTGGAYVVVSRHGAPEGWSFLDFNDAALALTTQEDRFYRAGRTGNQTVTLTDGLSAGDEIVIAKAANVTGNAVIDGVTFSEGTDFPATLTLVPGEAVRLHKMPGGTYMVVDRYNADGAILSSGAGTFSGTVDGDALLAGKTEHHFHAIFGPVSLTSTQIIAEAVDGNLNAQGAIAPYEIPQGAQGFITANGTGALTVHYETRPEGPRSDIWLKFGKELTGTAGAPEAVEGFDAGIPYVQLEDTDAGALHAYQFTTDLGEGRTQYLKFTYFKDAAGGQLVLRLLGTGTRGDVYMQKDSTATSYAANIGLNNVDNIHVVESRDNGKTISHVIRYSNISSTNQVTLFQGPLSSVVGTLRIAEWEEDYQWVDPLTANDPQAFNAFNHDYQEKFLIMDYEGAGGFNTLQVTLNGVPVTYTDLNQATDDGNGGPDFASGANQNFNRRATSVEGALNIGDEIRISAGSMPPFSSMFIRFTEDTTVRSNVAIAGEYRMTLAEGGVNILDADGNSVYSNGQEAQTYLFTRTHYGWGVETNGIERHVSPPIEVDYEALQEAEIVNTNASTGVFRLGIDQPATPTDIPGNNNGTITVNSGFDFTQTGELSLRLTVIDAAAATTLYPWSTQTIDVARMLERFNAGATGGDARLTLFDNAHLILNVVDPATGEFTLSEAGRNFRYVKSELMLTADESPALLDVANVTTFTTTTAFQNLGDVDPLFTGADGDVVIIEYGDGYRDEFTLIGGIARAERKGISTSEIEIQATAGQLEIRSVGAVSGIVNAWYRPAEGTVTINNVSGAAADIDTIPLFAATQKTAFGELDGEHFTTMTDSGPTQEATERAISTNADKYVKLRFVRDPSAAHGANLRLVDDSNGGNQAAFRVNLSDGTTSAFNTGTSTAPTILKTEVEEKFITIYAHFATAALLDRVDIAPAFTDAALTPSPAATGSLSVVALELFDVNPLPATGGADTSIVNDSITANAANQVITLSFNDGQQTWNNVAGFTINQNNAAFPGFYGGFNLDTGAITFDVIGAAGVNGNYDFSPGEMIFNISAGTESRLFQLGNTNRLFFDTTTGADLDSAWEQGAGYIDLQFGAASELRLNGAAGTVGQVATSAGPGLPPTWTTVSGGGGVTDHGALTGLGDDDHPQYATDTDVTAVASNVTTNATAIAAELVADAAQDLLIGANTAKNSYPAADATKLAGIEASATADQTGAELEAAIDTELGHNQWKVDNSAAITANTAKVGYTEAAVSANTDVAANTAARHDGAAQDTAIALNTAKVSADGSVDTHSDVDTTTAAPTVGQVLEWDGTNWVPATVSGGGASSSVVGFISERALNWDHVPGGAVGIQPTTAVTGSDNNFGTNVRTANVDMTGAAGLAPGTNTTLFGFTAPTPLSDLRGVIASFTETNVSIEVSVTFSIPTGGNRGVVAQLVRDDGVNPLEILDVDETGFGLANSRETISLGWFGDVTTGEEYYIRFGTRVNESVDVWGYTLRAVK